MSLNDAKFSVTSGDIDLTKLNVKNITDINATIDVSNDALFSFVTDVTSGNIKVNFEYTVDGTSNQKDYITGRIGESTNHIKIKTLSGNITIK